MNISFNQVDGHHEQAAKVNTSYKASASGKENKTSGEQAVFAWDHKGNGIGMQAYRDNDGKNGILDQASAFDEKNSKNYMVVMSNTMSDEDYKKLQENGGNPGDSKPGDMVTIMDQIKVTLAKSGVQIAGFTDTLDAATIKETGISDGYANAIANALVSKNLPATEDNIKSIATQLDKAQSLDGMSDGAKKYLIENELPPTVDNLYKAKYAGGTQATASQGYYGAGAYGYMAKKGTAEDLSSMEGQIKDVIEKAGLEADEANLERANWLLEKGLPLTEENLHYLADLDVVTFPMDLDKVALAAADAISVGLTAKDADLTVGDGYQTAEAGYIETAISIEEKTQAISDGDIKTAIEEGKSLTLYTLFQMSEKQASKDAVNTQDFSTLDKEKSFLEAKRQLVQIQLHMSAQANLKLMKQGISIDLQPLHQLAQMLEKEERLFHSTELNAAIEKTDAIKGLPEETIGVSVKEAWLANRVYTLDHVYETGKAIAADFAKAGQSYEALMTAPRADLGDRIQKAFRNVDDLLAENGMEVTDENRKAVRILGYNQMEITEDNLQAVKEADAMLNKVLRHLTPEKTLQMLRDGVNPMNMNLDELADYLSAQQDESASLEKYSKYLYRLEKNNEISAEEKEAYIGIYRLLRQIEKGDDAALGTVVANNQDLNLENLLSAVRTRKKGFIDTKIDDAFGLIKEVQKKGTDISDQIKGYYQTKAEQLTDELANGYGNVAGMSEHVADGMADNMADSMQDNIETADDFYKQNIDFMKDIANVSEDIFAELADDGITATANQVMAEQMLSDNTSFVQDLRKLSKDNKTEDAFLKDLEQISDAFDEGEEAVKEAYEVFAKRAAEQLETAGANSESHIDVRSYAFDMRQVSLWSEHAKQENYYVPMQLSDNVAMVHIKVVNGAKKGTVTVDLKAMGDELGKAAAVFTAKDGKIEGLIGAENEADLAKYQRIAEKCADFILEKTGKEADITCVYSQTMNLNAFYGEEKNTSTKELYQVAKAFIQSIEQEVTSYES